MRIRYVTTLTEEQTFTPRYIVLYRGGLLPAQDNRIVGVFSNSECAEQFKQSVKFPERHYIRTVES